MYIFNKKTMISNIAILAKEKNMKLGELETESGVSAGYFSRLNKDDNSAVPSIELTASVADKLGVTVDCLIRADYRNLCPTDRYLIGFINKLISKATSLEMSWDEETPDNIVTEIHPLFEYRTFNTGCDPDNGYPVFKEFQVYNSLFHKNDNYMLAGPVYHVDFENVSVLWIAKAAKMQRNSESVSSCPEIELYMQTDNRVIPVCHTKANEPALYDSILQSLYNAASESSRYTKIDVAAKSVIDKFMVG